MGCQFAHIETYSVSGGKSGRSVSGVTGEAGRDAGFCDHVANPLPPVVLSGMTPAELRDFHDAQIAKTKRGRGKGNSLRKDSPTLVGAVFSFQYRPDQKDNPAYLAARDAAIAFFRTEMESRGGTVLSIVQHEDESWLHFHAYAMNLDDPKFAAKLLHRGHVAANPVKAAGGKGVIEYCAAMRGFQDDYAKVAERHGQTRHGQRRQRLTRAEWKTQKAEYAHRAERLNALDGAEQLVSVALTSAAAAEAKAAAAEQKALVVVGKAQAFEIGLVAWGKKELTDEMKPAKNLAWDRGLALLDAIAPARDLLRTYIKSVVERISEFSESVKEQIKSEMGIDAPNLTAKFFGKDRPGM